MCFLFPTRLFICQIHSLKYGFCNKSFRKDEILTSWTLLQHICPHLWAWLLFYSAITPKRCTGFPYRWYYNKWYQMNSLMTYLLTWKHWRAQILQKVVFKNWVILEKDNAAPENSSKFEIQIIWMSNCPKMSNWQIDHLLDNFLLKCVFTEAQVVYLKVKEFAKCPREIAELSLARFLTWLLMSIEIYI